MNSTGAGASPALSEVLGPLPEPTYMTPMEGVLFNAVQMRAYAAAAVAAERERCDTEAVLNLLIREKQKTERLRATLQEIGAAAVSQPCPQLDKPTDFAISQSRGMQLAMIARAADEALGA